MIVDGVISAKLVDQIKEELIMLSLIKDVKIVYEADDILEVCMDSSDFFVIYTMAINGFDGKYVYRIRSNSTYESYESAFSEVILRYIKEWIRNEIVRII